MLRTLRSRIGYPAEIGQALPVMAHRDGSVHDVQTDAA
jgi:hypothetical protein